MKKCNVIGCSDRHYCKGLCQKHYRQYQRGTLKDPVKDIDSLLDTLKSYEDIIHYQASNVKSPRMKEFFSLLESIIE